MLDDGTMKDDVKKPEGDVGDKIEKLFRTEEKDTSKFCGRYTDSGARQTWLMSDVIVLTSMGEEVAIEAKEAPRG